MYFSIHIVEHINLCLEYSEAYLNLQSDAIVKSFPVALQCSWSVITNKMGHFKQVASWCVPCAYWLPWMYKWHFPCRGSEAVQEGYESPGG